MMNSWGYGPDPRMLGYDGRRQPPTQRSTLGAAGFPVPYPTFSPQCAAPPPPATLTHVPPTPQGPPGGPLDRIALCKGCLLCNGTCQKWDPFCCEDHRVKYFATYPAMCRQCCSAEQYTYGYIDDRDQVCRMRHFRDEVCSYTCGVFHKFHLPGRVTSQTIDLYIRETSSLQAQEALRQLKRPVPSEYVCFGCRAVPSAPWSLFCSEDCRRKKSLASHQLCPHCFLKPRAPNAPACSEECGYCLKFGLPGRATWNRRQEVLEFQRRLQGDIDLDARKRMQPEATELPRRKEPCPKCTRPLSLSEPLMDSIVRLHCGHEFHSGCIHDHLRNQPQGNFCPVCGEKFANIDMSQTPVVFTWLTTAASFRRLEDYQ